MSPVLILVHEPTSHWSAELARRFADRRDIVFRWRPYQAELLEELSAAAIIILVTPADDASLDLVRELRRRSEQTEILCLIPEETGNWEWVARELGAAAVFPDVAVQHRIVDAVSRMLPDSEEGHTDS